MCMLPCPALHGFWGFELMCLLRLTGMSYPLSHLPRADHVSESHFKQSRKSTTRIHSFTTLRMKTQTSSFNPLMSDCPHPPFQREPKFFCVSQSFGGLPARRLNSLPLSAVEPTDCIFPVAAVVGYRQGSLLLHWPLPGTFPIPSSAFSLSLCPDISPSRVSLTPPCRHLSCSAPAYL